VQNQAKDGLNALSNVASSVLQIEPAVRVEVGPSEHAFWGGHLSNHCDYMLCVHRLARPAVMLLSGICWLPGQRQGNLPAAASSHPHLQSTALYMQTASMTLTWAMMMRQRAQQVAREQPRPMAMGWAQTCRLRMQA
jgi:hypothetical protein